jgi:hypothetical protein
MPMAANIEMANIEAARVLRYVIRDLSATYDRKHTASLAVLPKTHPLLAAHATMLNR